MDDLGNENVQKKPVIEWCELEFFKGVRAKASHKQQNGGVFDGWKKICTLISVKLGIWEILSYTIQGGFC